MKTTGSNVEVNANPEKGSTMNGAHALMSSLADSGIDTLFANPGTTELHLVEAAQATPSLRAVLALFEGVVVEPLTVSAESPGARQRHCCTLDLARAMPGRPFTMPAGRKPRS